MLSKLKYQALLDYIKKGKFQKYANKIKLIILVAKPQATTWFVDCHSQIFNMSKR